MRVLRAAQALWEWTHKEGSASAQGSVGKASARPCVSRSILRGFASELISLPRNLGNVSVAPGTLSQRLVGLQGSRSRSRLTNWCGGTLAISSVKRGKHGWLRPKPTLLSRPSTGHQSAERFLEWQLVSSGMVIKWPQKVHPKTKFPLANVPTILQQLAQGSCSHAGSTYAVVGGKSVGQFCMEVRAL